MLRGKQLDKMEESILQDVVEWITETHAKFPRIEINENK